MTSSTVSVVIPVCNEPLTLERAVADLAMQLSASGARGWDIIVVDDGSSPPVAAIGALTAPEVRLIRLRARHGSGHARRRGAREAGGELIAWIDADGTYDAADLIGLVKQMGEADQIVGTRSTDFGRLRLLRRTVKAATCWTVSWLWRTEMPDLNSGLRVFRRDALIEILDELPNGFSCTSTATLAALNRGQTVRFMPISYRAREAGATSKFHPLWDTFRLWRVICRQYRRRGRRTNIDVSNGRIHS